MGIMLSRKISSDLEAWPPVFGRYSSLDVEFATQPANYIRKYKRATASPAGGLAGGRNNDRVAESPLRKRLKYDNISKDAVEKVQIYMQDKRPSITKAFETQTNVPSSDVKNNQAEEQVLTTPTRKPNYRMSLRKLIRRRPSYRKALQTPAKLPLTKVSNVIREKTLESEHKIKVVDTITTQAEICAMDTIIESLNESEYAELESGVSSEEALEGNIIFENLTTELEPHYEDSSDKQPDSTTLKKKSSFKMCRHKSQRHKPYETIKPKSTEQFGAAEQSLVRVGILDEDIHLTTKEHLGTEEPEESPLPMGKLLTELKQRIAEMKERKRTNSLPNMGRVGQDKPDGLQMRFISDMSVGQAQIFEKLMIELRMHVAERNAKLRVDNLKKLESSRMEEMLHGY